MEHDRDGAAAQRFRRGDPGGLEELYDRYAGTIYRFLCSLTADPSLRDDVFQDTWVRLARSIRSRGVPQQFQAYAIATARNLFRDRMRHRKRESGFLVPAEPSGTEGEPGWRWPDPEPGPRESLERTRLADRLAAEVRRLPPKEREVFVLRMETGLTFREIAAMMKRPIGTVLARMHRATERLRRNLGDIEWSG